MLRSLALAGVKFVAVGSAGLVLITGERYVLPDADVLLAKGELRAFVKWASSRGSVTVWGEPWRDELETDGKHYVRAVIDGLQLDASFEEPDYDADALVREAKWIDGVPVCPEPELRAMRLRPRT